MNYLRFDKITFSMILGRGSNVKINYQWLVYSFLEMSRIIYKIIKIFQNIVIIILLFYVILYENSATNFEYRLLYDIHDLPCSTFKIFYHHGGTMWHVVRQNNFAHGTLGHDIEHG